MVGAWIEDGTVSVRNDLPDPVAGDGEVVVRVLAVGICGTDLGILRGELDFRGIPGHELVGVVENGPQDWRGIRVVAEINVTCPGDRTEPARCRECRAGRSSHCLRRTAIGIRDRPGALARRIALPSRNLHTVPTSLSDEVATLVEPLAAAFRILEQVEIDDDDSILVVGPGRLGILVARVVEATGARVLAAGRSRRGIERARAAGLATVHRDEVAVGTFDVAIDCAGDPTGFALARSAVRPAGTLVVKSTYARPFEVDVRSLMVEELRIVGSRCGPFPRALDALATGAIEVQDLIDSRFSLSDTPAAFHRAAQPGAGKVLVVPEE